MTFDRNVYGWIEVCGIILSLTFVICMSFGEYRKTRLNKLFIRILLCNATVLLAEVMEWAFNGSAKWYAPFILNSAHILIFIFCYLFAAFFTDYLVTYIATKATISRRIVYIMWGWCIAELLLYALAYFNNLYCYFDENNLCQIAEYFWVSQAVGMVPLIVNGAIIVLNYKTLGSRESLLLLSFVIAPVVAVFLQLFTEVAVLAISVTFSITIIYIGIQSDLSRRLKQQETALLETRIDVMLSQIQPHFLYNTLNTIENLCRKDGQQAAALVRNFSKYLRDNMESLKQKTLVPFDRELEHMQIYLEIERLRFEERLNVVFDFETTDFSLPILTVQPLVENAVRHGVTKKPVGGTVTVSTRREPDWDKIIVADDGVGFVAHAVSELSGNDGRSHVGIENVRSRLAAQCGGTLEIESVKGSGTTATISIPRRAGR